MQPPCVPAFLRILTLSSCIENIHELSTQPFMETGHKAAKL